MKSDLKYEVVVGEAYDLIAPLIQKLLDELGEESDDTGEMKKEKIIQDWKNANYTSTVIARDKNNTIIGYVTIVECFAVYANGNYGVINEMYVEKEYRFQNVGAKLIDEVKKIGIERCWERIDVTAPESDRWIRTRKFYEKNGFEFTGPKLKMGL